MKTLIELLKCEKTDTQFQNFIVIPFCYSIFLICF